MTPFGTNIRRTSAASAALQVAQAALNKVNAGVVLIDTNGNVQFINDAARRLMQRTGAIAHTCNRLTFAIRATSRCLEAYLQHSRAAHREGHSVAPLAIRLASTCKTPGYFVIVSPLLVEPNARDPVEPLYCVVTIFERQVERVISTEVLRNLYGLSAAESGVTQRLYAGRRAEQLGGELGISLNTVRTHLKRIFQKCSVRSQAELLQLLALGPQTL
jgi:DNA-binding CsgD family transcriptional regulator